MWGAKGSSRGTGQLVLFRFPFSSEIHLKSFLNPLETVITIFELILNLQRCSSESNHFINAQQAIFLITISEASFLSVPAAVEDISLREVVSASSSWLCAVPTSRGSCGRRSLWASASSIHVTLSQKDFCTSPPHARTNTLTSELAQTDACLPL